MGGACSACGGQNRCIQGFSGENRWKERPLGTLSLRWDDNIKMEVQKVGWVGMDWIDLTLVRGRWLAVVNAVMDLRVT